MNQFTIKIYKNMSNTSQSSDPSAVIDQKARATVGLTTIPPRCGLNVISLFSGGGGLDLGLEAAGFQTHFENDIDPYSCSTLKMGRLAAVKRGLSIFCNSVVLDADVKSLEGKFVLESSRLRKGGVSLLAGGPPCQAFSVFGNRKGRGDHRGQLVYEYFRLLSQISPEAFLFENVYGLLTVENGAVFKMACEQLKEPRKGLRYELSVLRLNAANYGVPQFRDRIFIIGSRKGKTIKEIDALTVDPRHHIRPSQLPFRTVKDALRGLPKPNDKFPANHTGRSHSDRIIKRYGSMVAGQRDNYTRINKLDLTKPSYTIIVGSDKGGGKGHIHTIAPREVSPRESARIQTFPDWWEFAGTGRHPIRQVGNAVPPLLGFAVANALREQIFGLSTISIKAAVETLSQQHLFPEWFKSR